jgi:uncharacterized protein DUF6228
VSVTFELKCVETGATVVLDPVDKHSFTARLTAKDVSSCAKVWTLAGDWFHDFWRLLANDWKGWAGERLWCSEDSQLELCATMDKAGHVTMMVQLQDTSPFRWRVILRLVLEAGQLEAYSRDANAFSRALGAKMPES